MPAGLRVLPVKMRGTLLYPAPLKEDACAGTLFSQPGGAVLLSWDVLYSSIHPGLFLLLPGR